MGKKAADVEHPGPMCGRHAQAKIYNGQEPESLPSGRQARRFARNLCQPQEPPDHLEQEPRITVTRVGVFTKKDDRK